MLEKKVTNCDYKEDEYRKRVFEYKITKKYDKRIINMYHDYQIMIDDITYPIEKFFILFNQDDNNPMYHLMNIQSKYEDILTNSLDKYCYNKVVRLRDTTAFIDLINSDCIKNEGKLIKIIDKKKALKIIRNWNGILHDKVAEVDAVENKNMLRRDYG